MITLYDYELSGNCYKIRLLLSMLGIDYTSKVVEFYPAAEYNDAWFREINPLGTLPVLTDDAGSHNAVETECGADTEGSTGINSSTGTKSSTGTGGGAVGVETATAETALTLCDSAAILVYLAHRYDASAKWYPAADSARLAKVTQWLAFADSLVASASQARLAEGFFFNVDAEQCRARAHELFRVLDEHLWFTERAGQSWLVPGDHPSIADIACFPYVILSEEGSISRQDYPAIRRWTDRVKRLPGFIVMPGVFPAGPGLVSVDTVSDNTGKPI